MEIICRELVKPSSQIPNRLKMVKLSFLDQLINPHYASMLFFYESKGLTTSNQAQVCQHMKQSLSNTLTSFYPFAGRVRADHRSIDCNDAGVEFIEARLRAHDLVDAIKDPNKTDELKQYIPIDPIGAGDEKALFIVQITFFDCGGIALGLYFSHLIVDATSLMAFLNAWAATCRGEPQEVLPLVSFDLSDFFPPRESLAPVFPPRELLAPVFDAPANMPDETFTTKMFVFNKEILALLKQEVVSSPGSTVKDPTRVELISAFIWRVFLKVDKSRHPNSNKPCAAILAVNARARKRPPQLLENVMGNCIMTAFAYASGSKDEELHQLVSKLRSSVRKIDDDYITGSQTGNNYIDDLYKFMSIYPNAEMDWCSISSGCGLPFYELDYGFGSPIWVAMIPTLRVKNIVFLISNKSRERIEACIRMEQDNLEMLETQINLMSSNMK